MRTLRSKGFGLKRPNRQTVRSGGTGGGTGGTTGQLDFSTATNSGLLALVLEDI